MKKRHIKDGKVKSRAQIIESVGKHERDEWVEWWGERERERTRVAFDKQSDMQQNVHCTATHCSHRLSSIWILKRNFQSVEWLARDTVRSTVSVACTKDHAMPAELTTTTTIGSF